jgi:hypothetical protein
MDEKEPHARVTMQMLYSKQLENERLLIQLNAKLSNLDNVPERISRLELHVAKSAWIERIAWAALVGSIVAVINQFAAII